MVINLRSRWGVANDHEFNDASGSHTAWPCVPLSVRPPDRRIPGHQTTNRTAWFGSPRNNRPLLHVLHADRRHPEHPRDIPHVVLFLRLDRHHLECDRRVRIATGQPDRQTWTFQRGDLRTPHRGNPRHLRSPGCALRVDVCHRDLPAWSGRGCHPRGHPRPGARLQPPDGPGVGHGFLDARPRCGLACRQRGCSSHARPLYERREPHRLA